MADNIHEPPSRGVRRIPTALHRMKQITRVESVNFGQEVGRQRNLAAPTGAESEQFPDPPDHRWPGDSQRTRPGD